MVWYLLVLSSFVWVTTVSCSGETGFTGSGRKTNTDNKVTATDENDADQSKVNSDDAEADTQIDISDSDQRGIQIQYQSTTRLNAIELAQSVTPEDVTTLCAQYKGQIKTWTPNNDVVLYSSPDDTNYTEIDMNFKDGEKADFIRYPKRQGCQWGDGQGLHNRPSKSGRFSARHRQKAVITGLDMSHMLICDVKMTPKTKSIIYDDEIMFMINEAIVISTHETMVTQNLEKRNGVPIWNFPRTSGLGNHGGATYCLGDEDDKKNRSCQFPGQQTLGTMNFDLPSAKVGKLAADLLKNDTELSFSVMAIGDDNKTDCGHGGVDLDVAVSYLTLD